MGTLHMEGKAKRMRNLAYESFYVIFSSDNTESDTAKVDRTKILGAKRVTKQVPVRTPDAAKGEVGDYWVNNVPYKQMAASNLKNLQDTGTHQLALEVILNASVVPVDSVVRSIIVVSSVEGLSPAGKDTVSAAEFTIAQNLVSFTIEAVHAISDLTMTANLDKLYQFILEM